jgi:hypothetical protein
VKCLKKVFGFEYCEELAQRIKTESTIIAQVRRDGDHDLTDTRYERRLASTGPKGQNMEIQRTTPVKKECKIQHFVEGFKVAENHSLKSTKSVPRSGSDEVLLLTECQVSRESDSNQNVLQLKPLKKSTFHYQQPIINTNANVTKINH